MNPSLDPACAEVGFTLCLNYQVTVEASTCGGANASLLDQQLDGRLASTDSLQKSVRFRLFTIPSTEEALRDLGMVDFVVSHLFSTVRLHSSAIMDILWCIERLEELHTECRG